MKNQVATLLAEGSPETVARSFAASLPPALGGRNPALLLSFASTAQPLSALLPELRARFPDTTVLGASTAGEFNEERDTQQAVAAFALAGDFLVTAGMGEGLGADVEGALQRAITPLAKELNGYPHRAALMLLDPLTGAGEEATLVAGALLGPDIPLAGGAAGDDLKMRATEVGIGARVASDAAVVAILHSKRPLGLGVAHGHEPISRELRVTRAQGNTVHELDGRPAWPVWAELTRARAAASGLDPDGLDAAALSAYLLRYEAGLAVGDKFKIRAPLARGEHGSLVFACGIPEGAALRITESVPERQIESARRAAALARAGLGLAKPCGALVFDCICRKLILGSRFQSALSAMRHELGGVPLAGFETYGEIALGAGYMSGFHNTTSVVLAIAE